MVRLEEARKAAASDRSLELSFNGQDDIFTLQNKKLLLEQWLADLQAAADSLTENLEQLRSELALYRTEKDFSFNPDDPDDREAGDPFLVDTDEAYSLEMRIKLDEDRLQEIRVQQQQARILLERITDAILQKTK